MGKKQKKQFHKHNQKKQTRSLELKENIKGFLIMSDKNKEKQALNDGYSLLNSAIEEKYSEIVRKFHENNEKQGKSRRILYNFDTSCSGVVFIKLEKEISYDIDVNDIIDYLFNRIIINKEMLSKNILKIFPISIGTLFALDYISPFVSDLIKERFTEKEGKTSINIELRYRNNSRVKKEEVIDKIINTIDFNRFSIEYSNPEYTIFVDITCDLMCMSILKDYYKLKNYNIHLIGKTDEEIKEYLNVGMKERVIVNNSNCKDIFNQCLNAGSSRIGIGISTGDCMEGQVKEEVEDEDEVNLV